MAKLHKAHKAKEQDEASVIEKGLKAIYEGDEKVDFTKLDRRRNRLTHILITAVVTLGILAGVGWGGFFAYTKYFASNKADTFNLAIDVPSELVSGASSEIVIRYGNPNTVPVTNLELDLRIPDTFHIDQLSPTPTNEEELVWNLGNLAPETDGVIVIDGVWIAETPSSTPIQVLANYRPANFNSDFQEIKTSYVQTLRSSFDLTFDGPEEVIPGKANDYTVTIKNTSDQRIEALKTEIALPQGFFLESSDPSIEAGAAAEWDFDAIDPGEEKTILLNGSFAADVSGFQYFDTTLSVQAKDRLLKQATVQGFTDVLTSDLSVQLIANGASEAVSAGLGDNLRVTLAYQNSGDTDISDMSLLLDFQSEDALPIVWNDADLDGGKITSAGITWDSTKLGTLKPGDKVLLNLVFPIASGLTSVQTDQFTLVATLTQSDFEVRSSPIAVTINSEAKLRASGRYYSDDGEEIGNGPIPPTVGEATTYRIYWTVDNTLHDLSDVEVTATLPPNVEWTGVNDAEVGQITYNPVTNVVTWTITALPISSPRVQSNFEVSVTPGSSDVGKFMKLTSSSSIKASDAITKARIESSADSVTTELEGDKFADGKGIVVE